MQRTALIMAGGSGERFWPLSRAKRPKQLLKLTNSERTMLEETIVRVESLIPPSDVFIVTSVALQNAIREALPEVPPENILAEPMKRNTAPCIALAAAAVLQKYAAKGLSADQISMAVLSADAHIPETDGFCATVQTALGDAETHGTIATIGIPPSRPETGYGYIELGKEQSEHIHTVKSFREKPNLETAQDFLESGHFLWNSGMFFWRLDVLVHELSQHAPEIGARITDLQTVLSDQIHLAIAGAPRGTKEIFEEMPDISIDYALMEKIHGGVVVKAQFTWDDVGLWDAMQRLHPQDSHGNVSLGTNILLDSRDSIVVNTVGDKKMAVAAIGVENLVIVTTPDGILICPKDRVQDVRKVVSALRSGFGDTFI